MASSSSQKSDAKIFTPKVRSNQKRQDERLRRGEARSACRVARARASTKYERTVSAFDRVRITPLQYTTFFRYLHSLLLLLLPNINKKTSVAVPKIQQMSDFIIKKLQVIPL